MNILVRIRSFAHRWLSISYVLFVSVSRTIRTVIWAWLDSHPDDFNESPNFTALTALREFAQPLPSSELYQKLSERLAEFRSETNPTTTPLTTKTSKLQHLIVSSSQVEFDCFYFISLDGNKAFTRQDSPVDHP